MFSFKLFLNLKNINYVFSINIKDLFIKRFWDFKRIKIGNKNKIKIVSFFILEFKRVLRVKTSSLLCLLEVFFSGVCKYCFLEDNYENKLLYFFKKL